MNMFPFLKHLVVVVKSSKSFVFYIFQFVMPKRYSEAGKFELDDPDHSLIIIAKKYKNTI